MNDLFVILSFILSYYLCLFLITYKYNVSLHNALLLIITGKGVSEVRGLALVETLA